ncbi:MAG TPA: hypothetical protein VKZ64_05295 [Arenimonas sp.]|jgi:hypothetical protein|nr:hypothetical protein [Arenimonas sp.]
MKAVTLAFAVVCILALTACASTSSPYAQRLGPSPKAEMDTEYMARVEAANRQVGSRVVWVNPPTKPVEQVAQSD